MIGSVVVAIGRGFAIKQLDESAKEAFVLTDLGVTGLKAVTQVRRSLGEDELLGIDDLDEEELLGMRKICLEMSSGKLMNSSTSGI